MRRVNIYVLAIALVLGGVAAVMARNWIERQAHGNGGPAQTIVAAAAPLSFGAELTRDNTTVIAWAAGSLPPGAFATREQLFKGGRRVALAPIERGELILNQRITGPGERASLSARMEEGMRAVTIRVDDVRGVAGFVLPGSRVDIALIRSGNHASGESESYSEIIVQNVRVLAIDQAVSEKQERPTVAKAVTVEVSTEQAQKVLLGANVGKMALLLRNASEASSAGSARVTESDLGQPLRRPAEPAVAASVVDSGPARSSVEVVRGTSRSKYTVIRAGEPY